MKIILPLAILLFLSLPARATTFEKVVLVRCYDGDTCTFNLPGIHPFFGEKIGVRIRGIDTPEIRGKCAVEKRKAKTARDYLRRLLKSASRIDLVDVKRGKYFRIIATIMADGVDVVPLMIEKGLGRLYQGGKRRGWC